MKETTRQKQNITNPTNLSLQMVHPTKKNPVRNKAESFNILGHRIQWQFWTPLSKPIGSNFFLEIQSLCLSRFVETRKLSGFYHIRGKVLALVVFPIQIIEILLFFIFIVDLQYFSISHRMPDFDCLHFRYNLNQKEKKGAKQFHIFF